MKENIAYIIIVAVGAFVGLMGFLMGFFRNLKIDSEKFGILKNDISNIKDGINEMKKQMDKLFKMFDDVNQRCIKLEMRAEQMEIRICNLENITCTARVYQQPKL